MEGARPPFTYDRIAGGRSNLTYRVTDSGGREWALRRPPLGKALGSAHDMGREHRVVSALADTPVPVPVVAGYCTDESVNEAPFYVMEFLDGPDPAGARGRRGVRRGRPPGDRRAGDRHAGRDPCPGSRRRRPRRARQEGGLRRSPAPALAAAVGGLEDPRDPARRAGPRPAGGADPRAGPGNARPRRLPARQHDPRALRRGRRGRRLGALHARRSAGRRRPAARLLGRGGRHAPAAVRAGDDGARVPFPRGRQGSVRGEVGPRPGPRSSSSSRSATGSSRSSSRASTPAT